MPIGPWCFTVSVCDMLPIKHGYTELLNYLQPNIHCIVLSWLSAMSKGSSRLDDPGTLTLFAFRAKCEVPLCIGKTASF